MWHRVIGLPFHISASETHAWGCKIGVGQLPEISQEAETNRSNGLSKKDEEAEQLREIDGRLALRVLNSHTYATRTATERTIEHVANLPEMTELPLRQASRTTLSLSSKMQKKSKVGIKEFNNGCLKPTIVNDVVAILETYSFETGKGDGFVSRLKACACICRKENKFYRVEKEITLLEQQIMDISRKRETYGIADTNNAGEGPSNRLNNQFAMVRTMRRTTSYVDDDHIFVGFKDVV
ncbi:hypothetical protein BC332_12892 [Capsicum chinense]|nr:hypothetical protein BC332_12892 [Capsicum chinense]